MSESQAFFLLSVLCDRLVPGYYSTTMYGTLLDQKVFESLVERTMPILWEHLERSDVQLSVVSLPWFLSLYINSMPLVFAFRVLDVFFLEGPKVLFQVGLAILRINGEELLDALDDGSFVSILKVYFSRLDESAHPRSENPKLRAITKFQELMVVAFKEFAGITHNIVTEQREKLKGPVLENIESFAKRTSIRNLGPDSKRLSVEDLGTIYDRFYEVLYDRQQRQRVIDEEKQNQNQKKRYEHGSTLAPPVDREAGRVGLGPSPTHMDYDAFREFLAATAKWAVDDSPDVSRKASSDRSSASMKGLRRGLPQWGDKREPADHEFMQRLFRKWATDPSEGLSLQNVVNGLARLKGTPDIMNNINYFFNLYDENGDGRVDREGILKISEALLFLSRRGFEGYVKPTETIDEPNGVYDSSGMDKDKLSADERFLGSVSAFIRRCFEYADPTRPESSEKEDAVEKGTEETTGKLDAFSIGDGEEDLLEMDEKESEKAAAATEARKKSEETQQQSRKWRNSHPSTPETANAALDPEHPLHITLPHFRMVILADELLEQFFDSYFHQSFHLSDRPHPEALRAASSLSSNLTTFSNIGLTKPSQFSAFSSAAAPVAGATGGIVPPGKGLRGVLDNIVTDGIRMAAEVKKRMDELERNALSRPENEDDEEDEEEDDYEPQQPGVTTPLPPRSSSLNALRHPGRPSSVRDADRDLLEGAEVVSIRTKEGNNGRGSSELDAAGDESNNGQAEATSSSTTAGKPRSSSNPNSASVSNVEFES